MHTAFFIADFWFERRHKEELARHGLGADVVAEIESEIAEFRAFYATNPPSPREERKRLKGLVQSLDDFARSLEAVDDLTMSAVVSRVGPRHPDMSYRNLVAAVAIYRQAAAAAIEANKAPKTGMDATRETYVAITIGRALERAGISLNDDRKGTFVITATVAFEALKIANSEVRNAVRRAIIHLG
jgi:hypothetical protein